jgi:hypothetical protein
VCQCLCSLANKTPVCLVREMPSPTTPPYSVIQNSFAPIRSWVDSMPISP